MVPRIGKKRCDSIARILSLEYPNRLLRIARKIKIIRAESNAACRDVVEMRNYVRFIERIQNVDIKRHRNTVITTETVFMAKRQVCLGKPLGTSQIAATIQNLTADALEGEACRARSTALSNREAGQLR